MARRTSFLVGLERAARAAARAQREAEAARRRQAHEEARHQLQAEREMLRLRLQQDKWHREQYLLSRQVEVERLNAELADRVASLQGLLAGRLHPTEDVILGSLSLKDEPPALDVPKELANPAPAPYRHHYVNTVLPLAWWEKLFRMRGRYERELLLAEQQYQDAQKRHATGESERLEKLQALHHEHEQRLQEYQQRVGARQQQIEELKSRYHNGDPAAVCTYFGIGLDNSPYPEGFPQTFRVAYEPNAKQLVLDYELPPAEVVPTVADYRYVKAKDVVEEKPRKPLEIKDLYRDVIASLTLRCIHECFAADVAQHVDVLAFNGFVNSIDPATGAAIRPYLISVRVTKERFASLVLDRIDLKACLRNLGAQVSPQPAELLPVKPLIEFDMVDKRFIDEKGVLSDLDSRPNLMDLTPAEFEALVGNLFTRMGLETKLTRTSRDGGVDAVAFDTRPILGGKVVIQAKRWSNTVGVSAVRDLYGTMMNEGANKGILVTTSSYGPDAYDFCKDKPVELIDGSGLLYHLEQVGVNARIIFSTDAAAGA